MRLKHHAFLEILRARRPLHTERFQALRATVAEGGDHAGLRAFLVVLNRELDARLDVGEGPDPGWAVALWLALVEANPTMTFAVFAELVRDSTQPFGEPLMAVAFEGASEAPPVLGLLAEVVDSESRLLQFRVRAVEALVTKSPDGGGDEPLGLDAQPALRFLNGVLVELEKGPADGLASSCARWALGFRALGRSGPCAGERDVLEAVADATAGLGSAPGSQDTLRHMLRLLRANSPLPAWHPAGGSARAGRFGALLVDKGIQAVLGAAAARWRAGAGVPARPERPAVELWPFHERVLEAALVDAALPPRARAVAAGLLRILAHAVPSALLSPRAELYSQLLLAPRRRRLAGAPPGRLPGLSSPSQLEHLLDALDDRCESVRRAASEACHWLALRHPAGFQPRHYTKLLPFLSDDDPDIRLCTIRTFQTLAGFRSRRVAKVVDEISARLAGDWPADEEEERARRDLEVALGITMDRLVDDVEHLQREVQALEARRRELLRVVEQQAMRVGEELHHEVLNTLTGYLATAIDERDYLESKTRLDDLVAELRRIMNNLYPRDLETEGFLQTIRNRLRDTKAQLARRPPGCTVQLDCPADITDATIAEYLADPSHVVLLYRIVLEGVINARKHAQGTYIGVAVRTPDRGTLEIAIRDNGSGQGGPFTENVGMGLMRRRAEEIGAEIVYQVEQNGGTAVVVRLRRPAADGGAGPGGERAARRARAARGAGGDGEA